MAFYHKLQSVMHFKLLILLLLTAVLAKGQEDVIIKDLIADIAEDLPEDFDLSEVTERLTFYKKNPINLNQASPEELKDLFFLSALQIANFFTHLARYGKLIDVLELQAISGFDTTTVQRLLPFVILSESSLKENISLKKLIHFGEHDLVMRYARVLETQKGFKNLAGNRYLGSAERLLFRYKYRFSNRIAASLIMEKDAGEKFTSKVFDFTSANITLYKVWKFEKISLGDYALQFGQGLTLWSGFGFGKGADVTSVAKKDMGLKPYSSANEYSFFRGIASTISLAKTINVATFLSYRHHDASLDTGFNGNKILSTINETGYHRTPTEIKNQSSLTQQNYGAVIQYRKSNIDFGIIAYQTRFNRLFIKGDQPYRNYHFTGKSLTNIGLYYNQSYKNVYAFGEVAKSLNRGLAFINGILVSLSKQVSAVISHRNYAKNYHSFFNQSLGEATGFNENGFYIGLNISPSPKWVISLAADYFKFPWLKFRIDAPSQGYEILGQLNYMPSKTFKAILRYKTELKQQNTDLDVPINYLEDVKKESYRLDINWRLNKALIFQHRIEAVQFKKAPNLLEFGFLIYQDFQYAPLKSKITGNLRIAYFNTASYQSRIYTYEDDVLYNFSFGMYSGNGWRTYANIKYKLTKSIDFWARYALLYVKNVTSIGSGLDEIIGNQKSEVKVQLRYQF